MTDSPWHGFSLADPKGQKVSLHIGPFPGRKNIALYLESDTGITALASFRGEKEAHAALDWLDRLVDRVNSPYLVGSLQAAIFHMDELADAWQRGALSEHDGKGGTRSNRNMDCLRQARNAIIKGAEVYHSAV